MVKYSAGILILFLFQCHPKMEIYLLKSEMIQKLNNPTEINPDLNCLSNLSYVPDTSVVFADTKKIIRMNIHFMNNSRRNENYDGEKGIEYAKYLIYHANRKLAFNKKMNLPIGNNNPAYNPLYEYVLTPLKKDGVDEGIYFHYDDSLYYYINEGKRNNYKRDVINKYAVGNDTILNVFYMVHHPDSIRSNTYSASGSGIALGANIKLGTTYNQKDDPWLYASLLNHEVGHVMGLNHSWNTNDGCDDTPLNPNCWASTGIDPCDGIISNNMMDYNTNQHAISPCQIGKIRKNMSKANSLQRKLLQKRWCKTDVHKDVFIREKKTFHGAKDLEGNLHIMEGGELRITCRLSMPENSEIIVNPGGLLILDGATIHNDCGKFWKGIKIVRSGKNFGKVYYGKPSNLENLEIPISFETESNKL